MPNDQPRPDELYPNPVEFHRRVHEELLHERGLVEAEENERAADPILNAHAAFVGAGRRAIRSMFDEDEDVPPEGPGNRLNRIQYQPYPTWDEVMEAAYRVEPPAGHLNECGQKITRTKPIEDTGAY